jgi:putative flippase GtrA
VVNATSSHRPLGGAAWRFLLVGGANTLVTMALLVGLSYLMPGWLAYTIAFGLGLVFSTVMASRWVFTREGSGRAAIVYALCYVAIYLVGLGCVAIVRALDWPEFLNALSVLVTAPLGFVAGRIVFRERQRQEKP